MHRAAGGTTRPTLRRGHSRRARVSREAVGGGCRSAVTGPAMADGRSRARPGLRRSGRNAGAAAQVPRGTCKSGREGRKKRKKGGKENRCWDRHPVGLARCRSPGRSRFETAARPLKQERRPLPHPCSPLIVGNKPKALTLALGGFRWRLCSEAAQDSVHRRVFCWNPPWMIPQESFILEPPWMIPSADLSPVHTGSVTVVKKPTRAISLWNLEKVSYQLAELTGSSVENKSKSVRSTLAKQRLGVFPDLRNGTPRLMLKRVMQNQPQVSPLAPQVSNHEDTEETHSEVPSKRVSSMGELQLPDVAPEDTSITVFNMKKKRRKFSISEFERAAESRLPQYQAQSALDSTVMTRSLRMSVGSLLAPDTVEKRGLLRRPRTRKAVDMQAFEGRVEQNMLKNKGQNDLVDSQSASGIRTSMLTSDAEMMMNSTELFVQPQLDEESQHKLSALEPQLSDSKSSAQRSPISDADQEEARLEGLVSSVSTNQGRTQRYSKSSSLDDEHVGRMTHVSPETPAKQGEEKQDHSQQSNPMAQISIAEEEVVCTVEHGASAGHSEHLEKKLAEKAELQITAAQNSRGETEMAPSAGKEVEEGSTGAHSSPRAEREITRGIGAESLGRHSHAFSSFEKPEMTPVDETDEQGDELQDQAMMLNLDSSVEEPAEDEAEYPASEEVSMKTPAFVRAPARNLLLSAKPAKPAAPRSPLQLLQRKTVPKRLATSQKKPREPQVPRSLIKEIFRHFAKMPVTREAFQIVEKCSERYFKQLSDDLEAYSRHAGRKTVEAADLEVLMRRQGLVTDKMPLRVLIERYLPLEYRRLLIPVAVSGNKVMPCK